MTAVVAAAATGASGPRGTAEGQAVSNKLSLGARWGALSFPNRLRLMTADPTRRTILDVLRAGERSAGDLADQFPVSRPAVSRHLRILRRAGLVRERRDMRSRLYTLDGRALAQVDEWLQPYRLFWGARLENLRHCVENEAASV